MENKYLFVKNTPVLKYNVDDDVNVYKVIEENDREFRTSWIGVTHYLYSEIIENYNGTTPFPITKSDNWKPITLKEFYGEE